MKICGSRKGRKMRARRVVTHRLKWVKKDLILCGGTMKLIQNE